MKSFNSKDYIPLSRFIADIIGGNLTYKDITDEELTMRINIQFPDLSFVDFDYLNVIIDDLLANQIASCIEDVPNKDIILENIMVYIVKPRKEQTDKIIGKLKKIAESQNG